MVSNRTYVLLLSAAALWCAAIVVAPLCAAGDGLTRIAGVVVYKFFHLVCHQLDDRSFHILGEPLAVCIRCTAIYAGFLVGGMLYPFVGRRIRKGASLRAVLLWSAVPMFLDVVLNALGVHDATAFTRSITGAIFGSIVSFTIIPVAQEGAGELLAAVRRYSPSHAMKGHHHA